jgi:hypothetical protein
MIGKVQPRLLLEWGHYSRTLKERQGKKQGKETRENKGKKQGKKQKYCCIFDDIYQ